MYGQLTYLISLDTFLASVMIGCFAYVYAEVLTDPQAPLNWLFRFADQHLKWWIAKPLITCFKCVSGQFGLWWYVLHNHNAISITDLVLAPTISIVTALIINKILNPNP